MSYTIYYDRRYIKIAPDQYMLLIQSGDNNVWEHSDSGKEIPSKDWHALYIPKRFEGIADLSEKWIFNIAEIKRIAQYSEDTFTELFKARHTLFAKGEYYRWMVAVRGAKTVEEYTELGNRLVFLSGDWRQPDRTVITTTQQLIDLHEEKVRGSDGYFNLIFDRRNLILKKRNKPAPKPKKVQDHFFMIAKEKGPSLVKLTKYGYRYAFSQDPHIVKTFKTLQAAEKYLEKHKDRLKDFGITKINQPAEF